MERLCLKKLWEWKSVCAYRHSYLAVDTVRSCSILGLLHDAAVLSLALLSSFEIALLVTIFTHLQAAPNEAHGLWGISQTNSVVIYCSASFRHWTVQLHGTLYRQVGTNRLVLENILQEPRFLFDASMATSIPCTGSEKSCHKNSHKRSRIRMYA